MEPDDERAPRLAVALGWLSGVFLGLLVDYGAYVLIGDDYPKGYTTFALVVGGAFLGMHFADRLGEGALKVTSITLGVVLAATLFVFLLPLGR